MPKHTDNSLRRATARPVAAMLLAVALAALASVDGAGADVVDGRTVLRDASSSSGTVAAVIAAAVRDLAGRRAASVAGGSAGTAALLVFADVAIGCVTVAPATSRAPIEEAPPGSAHVPARLLALPPPLR